MDDQYAITLWPVLVDLLATVIFISAYYNLSI